MNLFFIQCLKLLNNSWQDLRDIISYVKNSNDNYLTLDYSDSDKELILSLCHKRFQGVPIEYIIHSAIFCNLKFYIDSNVLIPRSDSEFMIFEAMTNNYAQKVLDLGSGSGCLSISYIYNNTNCNEVTFVDISEDALNITKKNYFNLIPNIKSIFIKDTWFNFLHYNDKIFDIIFFNPPYIDSENDVYDESLKYEPKEALFAKDCGMEHYNFVLSNIANHMNYNSELYIELSYNNVDKIRALILKNNLFIQKEIYDMSHLRSFKLQKRKLLLPYDIIEFTYKFNKSIRLVGGSVRDLLLGKSIKDYDFCTILLPDEIIKLANRHHWKVLLHGYQHGVISVLYQNHIFEISSLRADIDCDGRHAHVHYGVSYEEDARRRDFSINAMSYDVQNNILYDYFSGKEHLLNREVKFIGAAEKRIQEDYLRILRYFRFLGRYGQNIEYEEEILKNVDQLRILSLERVVSEFNNIFNIQQGLKNIIQYMYKLNIFKVICNINKINLDHAILGKGANLVYATLFYDKLNIYFKMPKKNVREIEILNKFFYTRNYIDIYILYMDHKISIELMNQLQIIENFYLPKENEFIRGVDIMNMGYRGKEINHVRRKMIAEKFLKNHDHN